MKTGVNLRTYLSVDRRDEMLLLARLLLMTLFVIAGWVNLSGFSGTVAYLTVEGLPLPTLTASLVIMIEIGGGIALALGAYTRRLALFFALFSLATAFIGHRYWTMSGVAHAANLYDFYKNVSIAGGFLLLNSTGAGRYSIDHRMTS